jgi:alkanesulfonate monooxygenase SsuD/methylene tetrahydromethanopterin reductase-like flavin-dependent oxidoreductase (luciferase family)
MSGDPIRVGIVLREQDLSAWAGRLPELAGRAVAAGLDHVTVGDHVSFADGHGADGLIQAAALLSSHPELKVQTGVYLLALRHPAVVARQLATIAQLAPGRFTFGVGVGGDDPSELELCGIDPRERGARTSEALRCLRRAGARMPRSDAQVNSATAGWRCGSPHGGSTRRPAGSRRPPWRRTGAAPPGSTRCSSGPASATRARRPASG